MKVESIKTVTAFTFISFTCLAVATAVHGNKEDLVVHRSEAIRKKPVSVEIVLGDEEKNMTAIALRAAEDGKKVYTIQLDVTALFLGGNLNIYFQKYGDPLGTTIARFYGSYGGLALGAVKTFGTAWMNYDVEWLKKEGWEANFQLNILALSTNINLWGLGGEHIGNTVGGGIGVALGIAGGRGHFF